jgi:transcriptional regulator with PAS, ATPase and Fis domain
MDGDIIEPWDLPLPLSNRPGRLGEGDTPVLKKAVDRVEKEALQQALAATNNNKAKAAKMLGIHRTILYKKMKKYGL